MNKKEILKLLLNNQIIKYKINNFNEIINISNITKFLLSRNIDYKNKFILIFNIDDIELKEENIEKIKEIIHTANNYNLILEFEGKEENILKLFKLLKEWLYNNEINITILPFDNIIKYIVTEDIKYLNNNNELAKKIIAEKIFDENEIQELKKELDRILKNKIILKKLNKGLI